MPEHNLFFRASLWLACTALVAMMMVVVVDVFLRHTVNIPVRGAYDLVSILLLIMIFSGMSHVISSRSEILIDIVDSILAEAAIRFLRLVTAIVTFAASIYLIIAMIGPATSAYRYKDQSLELGLPVWTLWVIAFAGMVGVVLAAWFRVLSEYRGSEDPGETHQDDHRAPE